MPDQIKPIIGALPHGTSRNQGEGGPSNPPVRPIAQAPHRGQKVVLSLEFKIASMDSRALSLDSKIDGIMDAQTFMKLDFGLYKRAFYEKMDTMAANITSSQTALETSLIHQFTEHQCRLLVT
ncbi:hypothetical protein F511_19611 [Dorcoceras hygrometricum]|uniref:Uncharacterized protein n=1 Tax=Dorcoceras hygrometricum TaxID=472368 RepID=A0A2Z7CNB8_9LAMI|nr:hypothetical protein F511_19611 [Dorcoceras hygrometricum]